jgi:hypothetical protein
MSSTLLPQFNILKILNFDLTLFLSDPNTWSNMFQKWLEDSPDSSPGIFGIKITVLIVIYGILTGIWFFEKRKIDILSLSINSDPYQEKVSETDSGIEDLKKFHEIIKETDNPCALKEKIDNYFKAKEPESQSPMEINLEHSWKEFSEGVHDYKDQLMNVYQAEDFFKVSSIINPYISKLKHYPSFFTSTGLLFTFIALTAGLSVVKQEAGGGDITGLDDFINALSAKFITSIIGLILAIISEKTIKEREEKMEEVLAQIVYELNRNFKRLTTQDILIFMQKDVKGIPGQIQSYFDKTGGTGTILTNIEESIKEVVENSVSEIQKETSGVKELVGEIKTEMLKVSDSMKDFSSAGINGMSEHLNTIGQELRDNLTKGLNSDIESLKNTMEKLPSIMESLLSDMSKSTAEMKLSLSDSQREMSALVKSLFEEIHSKQGSNLNQLLENIMTKNQELSTNLAQQQEDMQRRHAESTQLITNKLFELTENSSKSNNELLMQMKNIFEHSSRSFQEEHSRIQQENTNVHESQIKNLEHSFTNSMSSLKDNLEGVLHELKNNIDILSRQALSMPEQLNNAQTQLNYAFDKLTNLLNNEFSYFINKQNELTATQRNSLSELGQYLQRVSALREESIKIQNSMDKLIELQNKITMASERKDDDFKEQLNLLRIAMQEQKELLKTHQSTSEQLQKDYQAINNLALNITNAFGEAGESMATSINKIKDAGQGYFDSFGKSHSEAIGLLKSFVSDMSETISTAQFTVKK